MLNVNILLYGIIAHKRGPIAAAHSIQVEVKKRKLKIFNKEKK